MARGSTATRRSPVDARVGDVRRRRADDAGFTLVEAVVLIAILGILASVAAPRFLVMRDLEGARAHRQLLSDLRHAQRQASTGGCPVQVDFETTSYHLRQRTACRSGPFTLELVDPVTNLPPYSVALPEGATLSSSLDPLVFDALGRITAVDGTTRSVSITLAGRPLEGIGETGFVRVP